MGKRNFPAGEALKGFAIRESMELMKNNFIVLSVGSAKQENPESRSFDGLYAGFYCIALSALKTIFA
jgi:hypothetical protein